VAAVSLPDPATVGHEGTYLDPDVPVTGIEHVLLAGEPAVEHGRYTGLRAGRVLRHGGTAARP
jgi:N-acyl-D-amino-acid deacylase